jgi:fluoride exporter
VIYGQIALGGALGALARLGIDVLADFSVWGTLAVNVIGSLLIGITVPWLMNAPHRARFTPFVITGILGGFTTFSAFAADTVDLLAQANIALAMSYVAITLLMGVVAVLVGQRLVQRT